MVENRNYRPSYTHVHKSGQQGCNRCWIIARAVQAIFEEHKLLESDKQIRSLSLERFGDDVDEISCDWKRGSFKVQIFVEDSAAATVARHRAWLGVRRNITLERDACLRFASDALRTCVREHWRCKPSLGYIPKRLVDVGIEGTETVKVVDDARSSVCKGTPYAALSYCWGPQSETKGAILTMTAHNLKEMSEGIPVDRKLPAVFWDAIKTTRSLGIRYLWIDALCIAQGDKEEWQTESLAMRQIYAGAYVAISADAASTCDRSFLAMPDRLWRRGIEIGSRRFGTKIYARLLDDGDPNRGGPITGTSSEEEEYKLHSRGWTLQELLLSPRLVYFRRDQVYFSCAEGKLSREDGESPAWVSRHVSLLRLDGLRRTWLQEASWPQNTTRPPCAASNDQLLALWKGLLVQYTTRKLSQPDDTLPAISGLASQLKQKFHPHYGYCAGLWREDFVRGLCWSHDYDYYDDDDAVRTRIAPKNSPSWSWVSCPGRVAHSWDTRGQPLIELISLNRLTEGDDLSHNNAPIHETMQVLDISSQDQEFGHIGCVEATIEGPVREAELRGVNGSKQYIESLANYPLWLQMDHWADPGGWLGSARKEARGVWNRHGGKVFLVALIRDWREIMHLVLVRSATTPDRYVRIGICEGRVETRRPDLDRNALADKWLASFEQRRIVLI
ncbi:hypothetical protein AYO21_07825 [Fonsecaea monophora]|uniref:Heterokaryon incompatibility domain-containing protein n=1 Tax=Fonsecaea monophora TaxID=254056 RepID=A0A177F119_9EURO|nr:hypothetical protein AYO21_07825 [Fonsecaea monophora]KAH0827638.1 hypothetical protein FOPE_00107 [Fonsecaea pedrosoi]OAG37975.1 hypothetical protein AYO21_07825 [Fonsecaea monophora]